MKSTQFWRLTGGFSTVNITLSSSFDSLSFHGDSSSYHRESIKHQSVDWRGCWESEFLLSYNCVFRGEWLCPVLRDEHEHTSQTLMLLIKIQTKFTSDQIRSHEATRAAVMTPPHMKHHEGHIQSPQTLTNRQCLCQDTDDSCRISFKWLFLSLFNVWVNPASDQWCGHRGPQLHRTTSASAARNRHGNTKMETSWLRVKTCWISTSSSESDATTKIKNQFSFRWKLDQHRKLHVFILLLKHRHHEIHCLMWTTDTHWPTHWHTLMLTHTHTHTADPHTDTH